MSAIPLKRQATISSKYIIYKPATELMFNSTNDKLINIIPSMKNNSTNCSVVLSLGTDSFSELQNLCSVMTTEDSSDTLSFNDAVRSKIVVCSCEIDSIELSDGSSFTLQSIHRLLNCNTNATIIVRAIHHVLKEKSDSIFPVLVLKKIIIDP